MQCSQLILRIAPNRIHFLKFILEGYDGLAVLSTVDSAKGIVLLRYPQEMELDVVCLLEDLICGMLNAEKQREKNSVTDRD